MMSGADPRVLGEALDAIGEGIQVLSPEWTYLYVNVAAARHGRRSPGDLVGRSMLEMYPGIETTPVFAVMRRCLADRRRETLENEFEFPDGARGWFELHVQPCPAGIVVVSRDVTEQKREDDQQRAAHQRALQASMTPVIRVHRGVLLVPLIGHLDAKRAAAMNETILERLTSEHAKVLILDVAGVPAMDTHVAQHLVETTAAARLLGASTILTGIAANAARTIVQLGVNLAGMQTTTDLAAGIELALGIVGKQVTAVR